MNLIKSKIKPNILVVDDIPENLFLIKSILNVLDVNIILANSGSEALLLIQDMEIAMALLDVQMPEMNGIELAKKILTDTKREKIPIIFITAHVKDEVELEKYYESGAIDFIQKPFRFKILLSKVKIFLELYEQSQQIKEQKISIEQTANDLEKFNQSLNKRLAFENLLSKISGMAVSMYDMDIFLSEVLSVMGKTLDLCRSCIFEHYNDSNTISIINEWTASNIISLKEQLQDVDCEKIPYWTEMLKSGKILNYSNIDDIPDEGIKNVLCPQNVLSILAIPLFVKGNYYGFIGFNDCLKNRKWPEQDVEFLKSISRIIVAVTERSLIEAELKQTQLHLKSSLESPKDIIIVSVDRNYCYLYFNEAHRLSMKGAYNKDVAIGMSILECITTEKDRQDAKLNFDIALSGKPITTTQEFGDIERVIFENSYNPIKNDENEIIGITLYASDITTRKIAEEELKNSLEQLHQLTQHVEKVREEERVNIARELHDDLGQALTAVKIDLGIIKQNVKDKEITKRINKTTALVSDTIKTVQKITFELRPKIIDDLGLEAGIDWYTTEFSERNGIDVILEMDSNIEISSDVSIVIFRIMQESLTNIARHANASQIDIQLNKKDNSINLVIADNGRGIKKSELQSKKAFGIIGMKERADSIGGTLDIYKNSEGGTTLKLKFPLQNKI